MLKAKRRRILFGGALGAVGVSVGVVILLVASGGFGSGLLLGIQSPSPKAPQHCFVGTSPAFPAYDPADGYIYVPNLSSGNVTVLKAPCTVVATIGFPTGAEPYAAAFDPQDNYVYVTDGGLGQVYVLSGPESIATLNGGWFNDPAGITYDPAAAGMLVTNLGSSNVTWIVGTSGIGNFAGTPQPPEAIGIDPIYDDAVEVTMPLADEFVAMTPNSPDYVLPSAFYYWPTGSSPDQMAYDPAIPGMLFTNTDTHNVTVFYSGCPCTVSVKVGKEPLGLCYSTVDQDMYVMNFGGDSVSEIDPGLTVAHTVSLGPGVDPYGCAYDDATGKVYVTGFDSNQVYVLS